MEQKLNTQVKTSDDSEEVSLVSNDYAERLAADLAEWRTAMEAAWEDLTGGSKEISRDPGDDETAHDRARERAYVSSASYEQGFGRGATPAEEVPPAGAVCERW